MNLRHAAALTFVGWYLMMPPMADVTRDSTTKIVVADSAPLSIWLIMGSYDSADECNKAQMRKAVHATVPAAKGLTREQMIEAKAVLREGLKHLICVASDDPRLKGN